MNPLQSDKKLLEHVKIPHSQNDSLIVDSLLCTSSYDGSTMQSIRMTLLQLVEEISDIKVDYRVNMTLRRL